MIHDIRRIIKLVRDHDATTTTAGDNGLYIDISKILNKYANCTEDDHE